MISIHNMPLLDAIADLGYSEPTPIQRKAIPLVLSGHDLFGIAQTGTGKTAAYMLPLLMKIKYAQGEDPRAVVLAPTRELVMQIHKDAQDLAQHTDLRLVALYGGTGMKNQLEAVKSGIDIIIATPGRFLDIYKTGEMNTRIINTMVLDEADKMLDMGFESQVRSICGQVRPDRLSRRAPRRSAPRGAAPPRPPAVRAGRDTPT